MTEEELVTGVVTGSRKHFNGILSGVCKVCGEIFFHYENGSLAHYYCGLRCRSLDRKGNLSPKWKGGKSIEKNGYVRVSGHQSHPKARQGQVAEHILVMEKSLDRYLLVGESVHHKNGVRSDNRLENLELRRRHPPGQTPEELIQACIRDYPKELLKAIQNNKEFEKQLANLDQPLAENDLGE